MKKRVAVLGATGSIGKSALDVIARGKDYFDLVLLSAHNHREELADLGRLWPGAVTVLSGGEGSPSREGAPSLEGEKRLLAAIADCGADITLNGISGAAGLKPSMAAIEAGSDLALANKETLVMAGPLVFQKADEKKVQIIPVDSEHSAVFHLIEAHGRDALDEIILTASGGPFRDYSAEEMKKASPQAALAHPTWNMGPKITIDSASMANKGLEVIEAARLFRLPPEKIKVVIHPQSIVHSMIRMKDGAVYAQLSRPDMRLPIHKALYWSQASSSKEDAVSDFGRLDFASLTLTFYPPDTEKFPLLALAYEAVKKGGLYPCAYNGANEAAVSAFLAGRIGFLDISRITGYVLDRDWSAEPDDIAGVLEADKQAKIMAEKEIEGAK
ncbi:MAG: 1-deoxy-D-xylulose-5-phosphate reductoisomerase [Treponema sp.]|jgi:1-deoxy-D-xylulose-5-phosphate reductoisomerase|nr:1-deoxy-D-xylulose-5-phosphate reductoisomerase [Treponema sp.]